MKQLIIVALFLCAATGVFAQQKKYIHKGNELYKDHKYKDAEEDYRKAVDAKKPDTAGSFNLGDALYKQNKFADASSAFDKLASSSHNKELAAAAYHNMGNSLLENKKLEESIDAYKKALLANPKDDETRYNLAYAQEKLKKQQQQNKQNQNNKNQQNQQNKDNKDKNDKNKDNKDQNKQNQDKQNQEKKDQQQQQPNQISKEDAERMLDALNNQEKQTQDKLKNKKFQGTKKNITKDW